METRERLIKLIQESVGGCARHWAELIADRLIANGVVFEPEGMIEDLDLSVRAYNALKRAGINTIDDLKEWDEERLLRIRRMGRCLVDEVLGKLSKWEERAANEDK